MIMNDIESKTCPHCNTTYKGEGLQELEQYFGWRRKGYTLQSYCKNCRREMNKKRYEEKREEILEKNAQYYQENREAIKKYYTLNRRRRIDDQIKWNQENADKRVGYNQSYYCSNKDKILANAKKSRLKSCK